MQRTDPEGIVLLCDFCRRDWDGQEPMIEGHHGSILCLECLKLALKEQHTQPGPDLGGKYKCTLCLRFNMPASLPHWSNPAHPEAIVCQECIYQSAKAFHKSRAFVFDYTQYPPPVKLPKPPAEQEAGE